MAYQLPEWFPETPNDFDPCDEHGGCQCNDIQFNAKTIISKALYGILADSGYLESTSGYSKQYMLQVAYDEAQNAIVMSDMHSQTDPPDDNTYDTISDTLYKKLLIVTYLSFDKYTAQFIEQVVMYGVHNDDGVWYYNPGTFNCLYHNGSSCEVNQSDISDLTFYVTYGINSAVLFSSQITYPARYFNVANVEDGKPFVDGIYKSYYFKIYSFNNIIDNLPTVPGNIIDEKTWFEIDWLDINNVKQYFYGYLKEGITISSSGPGLMTVTGVTSGTVMSYNFNVIPNYQIYQDFINAWMEEITSKYALQHYQELDNLSTGHGTYDAFVAEESHLMTWSLREDIVDSIDDCEIPCERFSFDTWVALMQKKMSAKDFFCKENITEATRILFTTRERCKNCGK